MQRRPQPVIAEGRRQDKQRDADRPANDSSIMLRMSRDQVAPMKTPSIWKASTPLTAVKAAQGMNATVAALTSFRQ